jgi:hypothetical protein
MHESDFTSEPRIRSLVSHEVFCPKCGKKNSYKLSSKGVLLNYFCDRCSHRMNDLWEAHQEKALELLLCRICEEWTFKDLTFCINCGKKAFPIEPSFVEKVFDLEEITEEEKEIKKNYITVTIIVVVVLGFIAFLVFTILGIRGLIIRCTNCENCMGDNSISLKENFNGYFKIIKWIFISFFK